MESETTQIHRGRDDRCAARLGSRLVHVGFTKIKLSASVVDKVSVGLWCNILSMGYA